MVLCVLCRARVLKVEQNRVEAAQVNIIQIPHKVIVGRVLLCCDKATVEEHLSAAHFSQVVK